MLNKWYGDHIPPVILVVDSVVSIAWLNPIQWEWIIYAAATLLLVPCFFASVWIERMCCVKMWPEVDHSMVRKGVFRANVASYLVLFVIGIGWTLFDYWKKKMIQ